MDDTTQVKPLDNTLKRFLNLIAKDLVKGVDKNFCDKNLKKYFDCIVQGLPDGDDLKTAALQNVTSCYKFFISAVAEANGEYPNTSIKEEAEFPSQHPLAVQALFVAQQLQTSTNIEKLSEFADALMNCCASEQGANKYCRLLQLFPGSDSIIVLKKIVQMYFTELQSTTERIVANRSKDQAAECVHHLEKFLRLCHMKQPASNLGDDYPTYADLVASLISLYLDLMLVSSSRNAEEKVQRSVCEFVYYLTTDVGTKLLDIVLQVTAADQQNGHLLLPLLRKIFLKKPKKSSPENYLRYVLAVRMWSNLLPVLRDVKEESRDLPAPKGFVHWLLKKSPALSEEVPTDRKFKGRLVTAFMLDDVDNNIHDRLLDVLVEVDSRKIASDTVELETSVDPLQATSHTQADKKWQDLEEQIYVASDEDGEDDVIEEMVDESERKGDTRSYYNKILEGDDLFCIDRGAKTKHEAQTDRSSGENNVSKKERRKIKDEEKSGEKIADVSRVPAGKENLFCFDQGTKVTLKITPEEVKAGTEQTDSEADLCVLEEEMQNDNNDREKHLGIELTADDKVSFFLDRGTKTARNINVDLNKSASENKKLKREKRKKGNSKGAPVDRVDLHAAVDEERLDVGMKDELMSPENRGKLANREALSLSCLEKGTDEVPFFGDMGTEKTRDTVVDLNKSSGEGKKPRQKAMRYQGEVIDRTVVYAAEDNEKLDLLVGKEQVCPKHIEEPTNQEAQSLLPTEIGADVGCKMDLDVKKSAEGGALGDEQNKAPDAAKVILDGMKEQKDIPFPGMQEENESGESVEIDRSSVSQSNTLHGYDIKVYRKNLNDENKVKERKTERSRKCKSGAVGPTVDLAEGDLTILQLDTQEEPTRKGKRFRDQKAGKPNDTSESSLVSNTCKLEGVSSDVTAEITENKFEDGSDAEVTAISTQRQSGHVPIDTNRNKVPANSDIVGDNKCLKKSPKKALEVSSPTVLKSGPQQKESNDVELDQEVDVRLSPRIHQKQNLCKSSPQKALQSPGTFESSKPVDTKSRPSSLGKSAGKLLLSDKKQRNFSSKGGECIETSPVQMQHVQPEISHQLDGEFKMSISDHSQVSASSEDVSSLVFLTPSLKKFASPGIAKTVGSGRRDSCGDSKKTPNSKPKSITPVSRRTRGQRKKLQGETPSTTSQAYDLANVRMSSAQLQEKSCTTSTSKKLSGRLGTEESARKKRKVPLGRLPQKDSSCDSVSEVTLQSKRQSETVDDNFTKMKTRNKDMVGSLGGSFIQEPLPITPPKKAKLLNEANAVVKSSRKRKESSRLQTSLPDSSPVKSHRKARNESSPGGQKRHAGSGNQEMSPGKHSPRKLSPEKLPHKIMTRSTVKGYNLRVHPK